MPTFATQQSLFRAYDIRGSRQLFTIDFVQALGHVFAHLYQSQQPIHNNSIKKNGENNTENAVVVIGYDVRDGSDTMAHLLADILSQYSLQVIKLGLVTTPMMVFWAEQYQGHGIIVTASHSAKDILGIKWLVDHTSPSSADIQALYQTLSLNRPQKQSVGTTHKSICDKEQHVSADHVASAYIDTIARVVRQIDQHHRQKNQHSTKDNLASSSKLAMVIVIDCMDGATSTIAKRLFERFCHKVIMLNDSPNSDFPSGNPDPTEPQRLKQLQQTVLNQQADIGFAFDGDGDRLMVIDNRGKVVTPDHLLYLLAKIAIIERPQTLALSSPHILFDIKCCHHLPSLINELGATPVMSKTGSSLMRQQMQQSGHQILFAGELSGHFIFNDSRFILYDDAMYAALRLLHWLAKHQPVKPNRSPKLADIIGGLPVIVSTADHYLPIPETSPTGSSVVQQLASFCEYLQQLIEGALATTLVALPESEAVSVTIRKPLPIINCPPSCCTCLAESQFTTLEQATTLLPVGTKLNCIDGVRLDFARGFGVLRQSNTSQNLTVRFAGDSARDLIAIQSRFAALCRPFNEHLAAQILDIVAE